MTDITENIKLEIGNTDLYHTGMRVKWDPVKEYFHTGSMIIRDLSLETAELELEDTTGKLQFRGYEVEWGSWHYDFFLLTKDNEEIPVDITSAIFTLKTPVPFSKF